MTISSINRKAGPYVGNDSASAFPFSFKVFSASDLYVVRADSTGTETVLTLAAEYTVSLNPDQDANPGGTITLPAVLASGYTLTVASQMQYLQPTDLTNQGGFYPKVITNALDRLTIFVQQLAESVSRSLKTAISTPPGVDSQLPAPVPYALIGWNSDGSGFANTDPTYSSALAGDLESTATGKGAALVGFKQTGVSAAIRDLMSKSRERLSIFDFMTAAQIADVQSGTPTLDHTAAIDAWLAEIKASGRKGYAPAGRYRRTSAWTIDLASCSGLGLSIEGDGMQRTIFDLTAVSSGVPYQVTDSNGSTGGDTFYLSLSNFGVHANINGVGAALGKNDLSDALNACVFDRLYFANASTGASACALEVNYVVQSYLNVTTNCGASAVNGDSLRLRQVQFSTVTGSGGNAANSMHLTGGYSFGNTILNWDAEEVQKCFFIDVATANSNTFIGGQLVWTVGGIDATAGANNIFMNPNFGVGSNKVLNSTGIAVIGDGNAYGTFVTPNTIVRAPVGDSTHVIDAIAGQAASETYARANVKRWMLRMDNSTESGSDAGSNIILTRFSDAGANLGDVWYVTRSNGQMTINKLSALQVGFFGTGPLSSKPTVTGSRSGGAALTSLIGALSSLGLINDTTSA